MLDSPPEITSARHGPPSSSSGSAPRSHRSVAAVGSPGSSGASGLPKRQIGQDAMAVLQSHVWPGNVRQLRNNVERVMILAAGGPEVIITAAMLPQDVGSMVPAMPTSNNGEHIMGLPLREAREVFERDYLIAQISRFSGNISRTAEFVGMERSALHRKLKALGVG